MAEEEEEENKVPKVDPIVFLRDWFKTRVHRPRPIAHYFFIAPIHKRHKIWTILEDVSFQSLTIIH